MADNMDELVDIMVRRLGILMDAKLLSTTATLDKITNMLMVQQETLEKIDQTIGVERDSFMLLRRPDVLKDTSRLSLSSAVAPRRAPQRRARTPKARRGQSFESGPSSGAGVPIVATFTEASRAAVRMSMGNEQLPPSPVRSQALDTNATDTTCVSPFNVQINEAGLPTIVRSLRIHTWHDRMVRRVVRNPKFDAFWLTLITMNAVFLGAQLQFRAYTGHAHWSNTPGDLAFTALFVTELLLRLVGDGVGNYLCGPSRPWALLDIFCIGVSLVDVSLTGRFETQSQYSSSFRLVRLLRILRIARVIRGIRFLQDLRLLIAGMINSVVAISWTVIAVGFVIYIGAVIVMSIVIDEINAGRSYYVNTWGGLGRSMGTMFQIMTGDSWWSVVVAGISVDYPGIQLFFIAYYSVTALGLLNIVTGIFVDQTLGASQTDAELLRQKRAESTQVTRKFLTDIFELMDADEDGMVAREDFVRCLSDPQLEFALGQIDIKSQDALKLFLLLDQGGDGFIDAQHFVQGCMTIKGSPSTADIIEHSLRTRRLLQDIQKQLKTLEMGREEDRQVNVQATWDV